MPLPVDTSAPLKFPTPEYLTLSSFRKGVITLIDKSRLPKDALATADNLFLVEDGQPAPRPGVGWFGTAPVTTVTTSLTVPTAASGTNWTTSTNVFASDDARATYATTTQDNLKITGFGFSIPSTATILGVTISVEGNGANATAANRSVELGLTKDGSTLSGTRAASQNLNQTTDTTLTFGSGSSMFSTTLTPTEVNTFSFGVLLRAANANSGQRAIDQVEVQITYTNSFAIDGYDYFDNSGAVHLVMATGGYIHRSTNDGATWTQCTGATYTSGATVNMNQNGSFLYLTTGVDNIIRYDGTTTLQTYTALTTPAAATIARTGLAASNFTVYYKISAVNTVGFTVASASVSQAVSLQRGSWDSTTNYLTLTLPAPQATQTRYDIYYSEDDLNYYYLDSIVSSTGVPNVTYKDDGTAVVAPGTIAPTGNTTQGILAAELMNVGSRMYGVRDPNNRYRIYFSGAGNYSGSFSDAYDGGYLDWQPGGKYTPVHVEEYQDGKGTPLATIWCDSADNQGCILQMSLDTLTIGDISITVPSAHKLPGSRGTNAPRSVVNVLNDYMFVNSQAVYNIGPRAQFLNLLSTDEASANIRPTIRSITSAGSSGIAGVYFDAKVYLSVPYTGSSNTHTIIYDTERKAWLPKAFTLGFKKFLRYTGTDGTRRLLALKPGDTRLSEISSTIQGDYGVAFQTVLATGLYSTLKNRYDFQFIEEGEVEFSNLQGDITVQLQGIERQGGFIPLITKSISSSATVTNVGWDTFAWDGTNWDDVSTVPTVFSESSTKRYFVVQKDVNAVQWYVTTSSVDAYYILRTLQTWGTDTQGGKPASWRLS